MFFLKLIPKIVEIKGSPRSPEPLNQSTVFGFFTISLLFVLFISVCLF